MRNILSNRLFWQFFWLWKNYLLVLPSAVVNCCLDDASTRHREGREMYRARAMPGPSLLRYYGFCTAIIIIIIIWRALSSNNTCFIICITTKTNWFQINTAVRNPYFLFYFFFWKLNAIAMFIYDKPLLPTFYLTWNLTPNFSYHIV